MFMASIQVPSSGALPLEESSQGREKALVGQSTAGAGTEPSKRGVWI